MKISQSDFEMPKDMDINVETDCSKYNEREGEEETIEFGDEF